MRRNDRQINDEEIMKEILKTTTHVTVALSMNDQPYLVTLSHGYDEERNCLYFHCATKGKKLDYIESNNKTWGQAMIDYGYYGDCHYRYASVQFSGKIKFIEDPDEKIQAMSCMMRQLDPDPEPLIARLNNQRLSGILMGRIDIDYMTGWHNPGSLEAERQADFNSLFKKKA